MKAAEVISSLKARGVELWQEGGALRYRAPTGVLTEQEKATLRQHKASILRVLATPTQPTAIPQQPAVDPATATGEPFPAQALPPIDRQDRRCYLCTHFQRSPYGFPLGLCQQHGDKEVHPNGRIQHVNSEPSHFGCISFELRQPDQANCACCQRYNPLSTMCSKTNTGCPYPAIPPCTGAHFEPKEVAHE